MNNTDSPAYRDATKKSNMVSSLRPEKKINYLKLTNNTNLYIKLIGQKEF